MKIKKGIRAGEEKKGGDRPCIIQNAMYAFTRIYSDEWKAGWKHTGRFYHCTHVPCILSLFASLGDPTAVSIPRVFVARFGKMWPSCLTRSSWRLRFGEPQHVHGTSKRENDFIIWRAIVFSIGLRPRGGTPIHESLRVLFFCFPLRFGQTSMFPSIDVFTGIFLRIARSTRRNGDILLNFFKVLKTHYLNLCKLSRKKKRIYY